MTCDILPVAMFFLNLLGWVMRLLKSICLGLLIVRVVRRHPIVKFPIFAGSLNAPQTFFSACWSLLCHFHWIITTDFLFLLQEVQVPAHPTCHPNVPPDIEISWILRVSLSCVHSSRIGLRSWSQCSTWIEKKAVFRVSLSVKKPWSTITISGLSSIDKMCNEHVNFVKPNLVMFWVVAIRPSNNDIQRNFIIFEILVHIEYETCMQ